MFKIADQVKLTCSFICLNVHYISEELLVVGVTKHLSGFNIKKNPFYHL